MTTPLHHVPNRTKKLPPLRVGIGGPVGSGKTTLLEMLCKAMREKYDLVAITNDIYTKEDQRLLTVSGALPAEHILGVETGGCPHTAIREDCSINLEVMAADTTRMRTTAKGLKPFVMIHPFGHHLQPHGQPDVDDRLAHHPGLGAGADVARKAGGHLF